ncbi:MAG: hypothetical protein M3506_10460 [Chloroflexota bacterium]|nr:hypothetical protein [Chloroflexota bacterium]
MAMDAEHFEAIVKWVIDAVPVTTLHPAVESPYDQGIRSVVPGRHSRLAWRMLDWTFYA